MAQYLLLLRFISWLSWSLGDNEYVQQDLEAFNQG
jgi:hypothetical protein